MPALVSTIIPVYNRPRLLYQAIASCAIQTWPEAEVVVVDDGSESDLRAVVATARERYGLGDRLAYLRQRSRKGGGAARNLGVVHARGEFVQFLDSDDLLHPDKFRTQVSALQAKPELDMALCLDEQFQSVPGDTRLLWNVPRRIDCSDDLERFLQEDAVWSAGAPLWRRSALQRVRAWDETLACWQDWAFHVSALCAGVRYAWIEKPLHYVRVHSGPRVHRTFLTELSRQRECLRAGELVRDYLSSAGLLTPRSCALLRAYFARHVAALSAFPGRGPRHARREGLCA